MKLAGDFLAKFNKLTPPDDALRRAVAVAAAAVLGTTIQKGQVSIRGGVAHIAVSSVAKHKLRMARRELLDLVYEKIPKARDTIRDVR